MKRVSKHTPSGFPNLRCLPVFLQVLLIHGYLHLGPLFHAHPFLSEFSTCATSGFCAPKPCESIHSATLKASERAYIRLSGNSFDEIYSSAAIVTLSRSKHSTLPVGHLAPLSMHPRVRGQVWGAVNAAQTLRDLHALMRFVFLVAPGDEQHVAWGLSDSVKRPYTHYIL